MDSVQGQMRRDASDLRAALTAALTEVPFMSALPDRRLLINLVGRDLANFPDVQERSEARLHVVEIVVTCLSHPGGLRALRSALLTMAPDADGTRKASLLIDSATLVTLLPETTIKHGRELIERVTEGNFTSSWSTEVREAAPFMTGGLTPVQAFDRLIANDGIGDSSVPSTLTFVDHLAACVPGSLATELHAWVDALADRLDLRSELHALRQRRDRDSSESLENGVSVEPGEAHAHPPPTLEGVAEQTPGLEDRARDGRDGDHVDTLGTLLSPGNDVAGDEAGTPNPTFVLGEPGAFLGDSMSSVAATPRLAESLPHVWGDVPPRNPNFTGREDLLRQLHRQLRAERETAVLPQALHGMGGVGKSQLAIEYVHRHSRDYELVWWISAEQEGQILTALTDLAQRLKLDASTEANSAVPAVREALSTGQTRYQNWLLVFDNAESLKDVRQYFPTGGAGKILVTSRNPEWERVAQTLEVDVFTREESKQFLVNRAPELTGLEADQLADALGDLPLAVEQAAAWRAATGMPVDEYLHLLAEKRIELLDATPSPDYELSVAAAWDMSLDKLEQVNPAALQLLQVCSFFAPEPISRDLFAGSPAATITPELDAMLEDSIKLARAIRDIQRYALARFDHRSNTLQMHRLIQAVLVGRMDDEQRARMRRGAHTLLANGNPNNPESPSQWPRYQALRPHLAASEAVKSPDSRVRQLIFGMVKFLYHWGDHDGCQELAQQAHGNWQETVGEASPQTLKLATYLSYIQWVNGKFAESAALSRQTLEHYRNTVGEEDEGTLDAMNYVASSLRAEGDFAGALRLDQAAFETSRRLIGSDDPETLKKAHNLAVSLRLAAEFARARALDEDTYRRRVDVIGARNSETLRTLDVVTIDQRESGDYIGARTRQESVYQQHLAEFGPDNPATMRAARNLAVARRKAGDHEGARTLAEETFQKFRRRYGDDYPDTMAAALNLAVDLRHAGQLTAAIELGEETLARYRHLFGERHPHTLSARTNLAIAHRLKGDTEIAYGHGLEVLATFREVLGPDHAVTLICATNLASDLFARGDAQAAYELDIDTLERSRRMLGEHHPSTLACGANLALDLRALGRVQEAEKIQSDTMTSFRRVLGDKHPATLNALQSIRADSDVDPMPL